jgi:nucleoside-diphosphate-sugar epimerase
VRLFVAGATGVIGRRLVPMLVGAGHEVVGMTREPERQALLRELGAEAVVCDAFDADELAAAVAAAQPEVVFHELTDLPRSVNPRRLAEELAGNARLRREGTRNLVAAAEAAGARRLVAQSIAFAYAPRGPSVVEEDAPLNLAGPDDWRPSVEAVAELERRVLGSSTVDGIVLRYGFFYGRDTAYAPDGGIAAMVWRRRFPIVGRGTGYTSFVHVDDAARATVLAVERGAPGIYNVVDDEPAPVSEWLPEYARAVGAPRPRRVPRFLARLVAGRYAVELATQARPTRKHAASLAGSRGTRAGATASARRERRLRAADSELASTARERHRPVRRRRPPPAARDRAGARARLRRRRSRPERGRAGARRSRHGRSARLS